MSPLIAVIPAVLLGTGNVLIGKFGGNLRQQLIGIALGCLVVGTASWPIMGGEFHAWPFALCILSGIILAGANRMLYQSFKLSGVAYSCAVTTGQQLVLVALLGVIIFGDWATSASKACGAGALLLLIIGTTLAVYKEKDPDAAPVSQASPGKRLAVVTAASLLYSIYPIIVQASGAGAESIGMPVLWGLFIGALIHSAPRPKPLPEGVEDTYGDWVDGGSRWGKRTLQLALAGMCWGLGIIGMLWCNKHVGVATAFPLSQLNAVVSALGGVYILGEHKTKVEARALALGIVLLLAGATLIGLAKYFDAA